MGKNQYWKFSRYLYRILIVICTLALIIAIILLYFYGDETSSQLQLFP